MAWLSCWGIKIFEQPSYIKYQKVKKNQLKIITLLILSNVTFEKNTRTIEISLNTCLSNPSVLKIKFITHSYMNANPLAFQNFFCLKE